MCMPKQLAAAVIFSFASLSVAQDAAPVNVAEKLPPQLRALLIQEMQAVLAATQSILEGVVTGQHELVAEKADGIHNSFILKQKMTPEDRQVLKAAVPEAFIKQDRAFHVLSADLAAAARAGDQAKQRALLGQMVDACTACHASYAAGRFAGLARKAQDAR